MSSKKTGIKIAGTVASLQEIRSDLNKRFRGCEATVEALLASMVAGEIVFLEGPRGEAKTAIVEALGAYISDGRHFSVGLAKSSTPDEILGALDTKEYVENGVYKRNADGFLPTATTFLIDEGTKANNPTLQALLRPLSERTFQGKPIEALFGAITGNELIPELRGMKNGKTADLGPHEDSLLAFMDRFFYKVQVNPLPVGTQDWDDVIFGGCANVVSPVTVTVQEVRDVQAAVNAVDLPDNVKDAIRALASTLLTGGAGQTVHVSTRTWVKATRMLKAHAVLEGRSKVQRSDLKWLEHALWTTPDQKATIREAIIQTGSPEEAEANAVETIVAEYVAASAEKRLFVTTDGSLAVADSAVSQMATASASEPFVLWLKQQIVELQTIAATAADPAEIKRVLGYVETCRADAAQALATRMGVTI